MRILGVDCKHLDLYDLRTRRSKEKKCEVIRITHIPTLITVVAKAKSLNAYIVTRHQRADAIQQLDELVGQAIKRQKEREELLVKMMKGDEESGLYDL